VKIVPIPVLSNNYSYLVIDTGSSRAAVVDPSDPLAVQVRPAPHPRPWGLGVLGEGHCWLFGDGEGANLPLTRGLLSARGRVTVGCLTFEALATPGHTVGHTAYVLDAGPFGGPPCLFSGDLLFLAGCGECGPSRPPPEARQSVKLARVWARWGAGEGGRWVLPPGAGRVPRGAGRRALPQHPQR
uniref:Metallo-beta-lactamase domain-containing protein n=1 Tax=Anser brachyrhynchus TaxID=132585 RepID=A0A8B9BXS7_9AVES